VTLLTPGRNLGFAAGVNFAARHTRARHILLLNPDTVLLTGAIDVIADFAREFPQHGIYGGRTLRPDGQLEPSSCWGLPSLWSLTMFATGLSTAAARNRWLDPESLGRWPRDTVRCVGIVTGCFLLARRDVWERLGGFDERYFMYGEDADLAARARRVGYRPIICPDACLIHEVGQSSATPLAKMLLLYRGKACFVRTHWKSWRRQTGLFLLASGVALRALIGPDRWHALWRERRTWLSGYDPVSLPSTTAHPLGSTAASLIPRE
jgi:GT2 family glycosyltransferase